MKNLSNDDYYIETEFHSIKKNGEATCGDTFLAKRCKDFNRTVAVLADGLGSGIKASVLSSLTTSMISKFVLGDLDIQKAAHVLMKTLPVCKERNIAYSTFLIVDMELNRTKFIEYSTPEFIILRKGEIIRLNKKPISISSQISNEKTVYYSSFYPMPGDRIILFSDGVNQAGMGSSRYPLGWGEKNVEKYLLDQVERNPVISARELAIKITSKALAIDSNSAKDDITAGVIYYRSPRKLSIFTGPPFDRRNDHAWAIKVLEEKGKKVVCGGTTAKIISRECKIPIENTPIDKESDCPPFSHMKGIDLVTEGCVTLSQLIDYLKIRNSIEILKDDKSVLKDLANLILSSDIIEFITGTRVNEALQDPTFPDHIDIRKNIVKELSLILEHAYRKKVSIRYT